MVVACLALPIVLLISSLVLLVISNLIFNPTFWMIPDGEPINATPIATTIVNGVLLFTGTIGLVTLLPGVVLGVITLTRNKRSIIGS